jgi:hypothetical protein
VLRYAARAVPWTAVLLAGVLAVGMLEIVRHWPGPTWGLVGCGVGLLAGAAAWSFDEPAAAVVDSAARTLAWRTTARSPAPLLLSAGWLAEVCHARGVMNGHAAEVGVWGVVAVLVAAAWASWRRSGGDATPGLVWAAVVVPGTTAYALAQPLVTRYPVFPFVYDLPSRWSASTTGWLTGAGLAALLLCAALTDARRWHLRTGRVPQT